MPERGRPSSAACEAEATSTVLLLRSARLTAAGRRAGHRPRHRSLIAARRAMPPPPTVLRLRSRVLRPRRPGDPRAARLDGRGATSGGSCSARTAPARRRSCGSARCTSTRRAASVEVLGERLGRTDVRQLRRRDRLLVGGDGRPDPPGAHRARRRDDGEVRRARAVVAPLRRRRSRARPRLPRPDGRRPRSPSGRSARCRPGEQQRVLLARTLMNDPGVLLLDEPSARLDLGGREQLVGALGELTTDPAARAARARHPPPRRGAAGHDPRADAARRRGGRPRARSTRRSRRAALSECFEMALTLERRDDGRLAAWARRG